MDDTIRGCIIVAAMYVVHISTVTISRDQPQGRGWHSRSTAHPHIVPISVAVRCRGSILGKTLVPVITAGVSIKKRDGPPSSIRFMD
jgi:hypothetical protein